jgi:hypothetical protein
MALARTMTGQNHQIETVCLDGALFQCANDLIIAHGER